VNDYVRAPIIQYILHAIGPTYSSQVIVTIYYST